MSTKKKIDEGGPAFPHPTEGEYDDPKTCKTWRPYTGMSMRDWFAGQALAGDMANESEGVFYNTAKDEELLKRAQLLFRLADAMLKAREAKP